MRLSLGVTTSMPLKESLPLVRLAEERGYSRLWVGEDHDGRDIFAYLSVMALQTEKINLGTGITSPWVRNIAVIANSTAGLQALSKGRFILGLGVGGIPEVTDVIGSRPRRVVSGMKEAIISLRRALKGEEFSLNTPFIHIQGYSLAVTVDSPKIYLGVRGSQMLALAGEVADGVILSGPTTYLEEAMKIVDTAAKIRGRDPGEVDRVVWNPFILVEKKEDINLAWSMVKIMLPSMPSMALKQVKGLRREEVLQKLCIYGRLEEIAEQLSEYSSMGFSEVIVGPPYGRDPEKILQVLGDEYGLRH
jgi:5,10-methylenetetrahydromethanopterin reductase